METDFKISPPPVEALFRSEQVTVLHSSVDATVRCEECSEASMKVVECFQCDSKRVSSRFSCGKLLSNEFMVLDDRVWATTSPGSMSSRLG
ncbi:hypothetical protein V6N11_058540 [Hibiscus sabdariffa]|uniref:Uncharacterized protein n=1 Tax=Hibiscus sabdariffa TaxID=183260 RepID=A0ABR2U4U4_9ROSI